MAADIKLGGDLFLSLLAILFIYLKLTYVITWSWWWVLSPLLIPNGIGIIALVIYLLYIWKTT